MLRTTLIVVFTLVAAVFAAMQSVGSVYKMKNPPIAANSFPENGIALASLANLQLKAAIIEKNGQLPDAIDPASTALVKRAFSLEPTSSVALQIAAINLSAAGKQQDALGLMRSAVSLTKRNRVVNFWLVNEYGEKDNIDEMFKHLDWILRTHTESRGVLFPKLIEVMKSEQTNDLLGAFLVKRPPWFDHFWQKTVDQPTVLTQAAWMRKFFYKNSVSIRPEHDQDLLSRLIKTGEYATAEQLYLLLSSNKAEIATQPVRNIGFSQSSTLPPFDWELFSTGELGAVIDKKNKQLIVSSLPKVSGVVAQQLLRLPKDSYKPRLKIGAQLAGKSDISLRIICADKGPLNNSTQAIWSAKTKPNGAINLNGKCEYSWLKIHIETTSENDGTDFTLKEVSLN